MIVYLAGENWGGVAGTDRGLAQALAQHEPILWVDPVLSVLRSRRYSRAGEPGLSVLSEAAEGIFRLRTIGPPGVTRPVGRAVSRVVLRRAVGRALRGFGMPASLVLSASPFGFSSVRGSWTAYYVTDDWVAGSSMLGLSPAVVERSMRRAVASADHVLAVSADLAERVGALTVPPTQVHVVPNGYTPRRFDESGGVGGTAGRVALAGQLNERLDLAALSAVADRNLTIIVVGPRTERDPACTRALDRFLARPNVEWVGAVPAADVEAYVRTASVGVTPYVDSVFNRASFPLKTFDYLGAGLPVVSTDLPASRWLASNHVRVCSTTAEFVDAVEQRARKEISGPERADRRSYVAGHSWATRARQVLDLPRSMG